MQRILSLCIIPVLCLTVTAPCEAVDYYVATNGNDVSNDGLSTNQPFRTIQVATSHVQPGDTIYVREGTYRETVTMTNYGTPSNLITIAPTVRRVPS